MSYFSAMFCDVYRCWLLCVCVRNMRKFGESLSLEFVVYRSKEGEKVEPFIIIQNHRPLSIQNSSSIGILCIFLFLLLQFIRFVTLPQSFRFPLIGLFFWFPFTMHANNKYRKTLCICFIKPLFNIELWNIIDHFAFRQLDMSWNDNTNVALQGYCLTRHTVTYPISVEYFNRK